MQPVFHTDSCGDSEFAGECLECLHIILHSSLIDLEPVAVYFIGAGVDNFF